MFYYIVNMTITNKINVKTKKLAPSYTPGGASTEYFPVAIHTEDLPKLDKSTTIIYQDLQNLPIDRPVQYAFPHEYYSAQALAVDRDIAAAPLSTRIRNPASAVSGPILVASDIGNSQYVADEDHNPPALGKIPPKQFGSLGSVEPLVFILFLFFKIFY